MAKWVIGHKNPDTDAICSAVAKADLLARTGQEGFRAARCGEVNQRTAFALQRAGVTAPVLVMDVRPQAGHICRRDVVAAHEHESMLEALNRLRGAGMRNMPVVNDDRRVIGMVALQKVVDQLLPRTDGALETRMVETSLTRINEALGGDFAHAVEPDREQVFLLAVGAMRAEAFGERVKNYPPEQLILVVGNRTTIQRPAIEYGARALVITGGFKLDPNLLEKARLSGTTVIETRHETATTTLLIKTARKITGAMSEEFLTFDEKTLVRQIVQAVRGSSQTLFPVLDDEGRMAGVFSKSDLINPPRTQLVLVDHNELGQAVTGAGEAEIIEVIDHHRIGGGLVSAMPIRFLNEPVGSTCTIVAGQFKRNGVVPESSIALCLISGIISDTLNLRSPTTTPIDREILDWLVPLAGVDLDTYADEFFRAGSSLTTHSADAIVSLDCKEYEENGWRMVVAQVEELGLENFWPRKAELGAALERKREECRADLAALMITDITAQTSLLMVSGEEELINELSYPAREEGLFTLQGVVSRKKQLLPELVRVLLNTQRE
ncbi:MAG: putative manganese-dependent inorganic diphosphatase [Candidatus Methylacidiphilales bacterium]